MLVLTRSVGERLIIGDEEVLLHVLEVRGNQVRLGIEAPRHISVHREEVYRRIRNGKIGDHVLQPEEEAEEVV